MEDTTLRQRKTRAASATPEATSKVASDADLTPGDSRDADPASKTRKRDEDAVAIDMRPPPSWSESLTAAAVMGMLFGMAFYKSHVYEPSSVRGQFLFQRFVLLKVFFGAMGTGSLCFAALASTEQFASIRRRWEASSSSRGWLTGPAVGGLLLGCGMAVSGACPGMAFVALGAGTDGAAYAVLGGLLGALVYGMAAESIEASFLARGPRGPASATYADGSMGVPYRKLALALAGVCLLGCVALEKLVPWEDEVPARLVVAMSEPKCAFGTNKFSLVECPAWPPSIAGAIVGLLQFPAVMFVENALGSSTAYQVFAAISIAPDKERFKYLRTFAKPDPRAWWQLVFVALAAYEAYLCAMDGGDIGGAPGVTPVAALLGGFLMIFGSRLGGGCTSGHGLSGCSLMMVHSWIAVPAMFAGGIAVSVLWHSVGDGFFLP